jgi:CheY-like chemotaxis protein
LTQHFILIVDDDPDIRETLSDFLQGEGYAARTAANGSEALAMLATVGKPCLILLDLMMPTMNGYEFRAEQIRRPDLASIPVVVITAGANVRTEELASAAILGKPLNLVKLKAAIQQHC